MRLVAHCNAFMAEPWITAWLANIYPHVDRIIVTVGPYDATLKVLDALGGEWSERTDEMVARFPDPDGKVVLERRIYINQADHRRVGWQYVEPGDWFIPADVDELALPGTWRQVRRVLAEHGTAVRCVERPMLTFVGDLDHAMVPRDTQMRLGAGPCYYNGSFAWAGPGSKAACWRVEKGQTWKDQPIDSTLMLGTEPYYQRAASFVWPSPIAWHHYAFTDPLWYVVKGVLYKHTLQGLSLGDAVRVVCAACRGAGENFLASHVWPEHDVIAWHGPWPSGFDRAAVQGLLNGRRAHAARWIGGA